MSLDDPFALSVPWLVQSPFGEIFFFKVIFEMKQCFKISIGGTAGVLLNCQLLFLGHY